MQIGQHLQQLCHLVALAKYVPGNEQILSKGVQLLLDMQHHCLQAIGTKELLQTPYLQPCVRKPLEACCSSPPSREPLRSVNTVPILWHVSALVNGLQSMPDRTAEPAEATQACTLKR